MIPFVFRQTPDGQQGPVGSWHFEKTSKYTSVVVHCPDCGKGSPIYCSNVAQEDQHSIDSLGNVHPSLVCPNVKCGFHQCGKLESWTYGHRPSM